MRNNSHSRGKDTNKYVSVITVSIISTIEKPGYGFGADPAQYNQKPLILSLGGYWAPSGIIGGLIHVHMSMSI